MTIVDALITFGTKLCGQAVAGETISEVLEDMITKYSGAEPTSLSVQSESATVTAKSTKSSTK